MYRLYYYDPETLQELGYKLVLECVSEAQCQTKIDFDNPSHYRIEYSFNSLTTIVREQ